MVGKPAYNEQVVLAQAIKIFWTRGYAATSIADLVAATGLSRSSLYQRFGDKDGLFAEALELYHSRVLARMKSVAAQHPGNPIEAILRDFAPANASAIRPAGCFVARSCVEIPALPEPLQEAARKYVGEQHACFVDVLRKQIKQGELPPASDTKSLGWYYLGVFHAVLNLPQAGATRKNVDVLIDTAIFAAAARVRS
jgi:TetR/AcrR family transcriptional regulator, copper-responsive repressor